MEPRIDSSRRGHGFRQPLLWRVTPITRGAGVACPMKEASAPSGGEMDTLAQASRGSRLHATSQEPVMTSTREHGYARWTGGRAFDRSGMKSSNVKALVVVVSASLASGSGPPGPSQSGHRARTRGSPERSSLLRRAASAQAGGATHSQCCKCSIASVGFAEPGSKHRAGNESLETRGCDAAVSFGSPTP